MASRAPPSAASTQIRRIRMNLNYGYEFTHHMKSSDNTLRKLESSSRLDSVDETLPQNFLAAVGWKFQCIETST